MVTVLGNAAMDFPLPDDLAAFEIEAIHHPTMDFLRRRSIAG